MKGFNQNSAYGYGVERHRDPGGVRCNLLEQLKPLASQRGLCQPLAGRDAEDGKAKVKKACVFNGPTCQDFCSERGRGTPQ